MNTANRIIGTLAACLLAALTHHGADAQTWPTRPVTMVVPYAAGSSSDTAGRVLAARLSEVLGQQVIIENVTGAGGATGTLRVARATPDGSVFVFASVDSVAIAPAMQKVPSYNSITDFAPVGLLVEQPILLVTRKDLPVSTMKEFVAYVKAKHGQMQFGSAGVGSISHFACAKLNASLGVDPVHVPYRGSNLAMQDLIAGRLDFSCPLATVATAAIENGDVKPIALLTNEPSEAFPNVTTAKQQVGISGVYPHWAGFFFPKNTPDDIVRKLNDVAAKILDEPELSRRLKAMGVAPVSADRRSPAALKSFLQDEMGRWAGLVKESGVAIE